MKRIFISTILAVISCISCSNNDVSKIASHKNKPHEEKVVVNAKDEKKDTNNVNLNNPSIAKLGEELNFDFANSYKNFKKFDKENILKVLPGQLQYERDNFIKYNGDNWITGNEKIRFKIYTENFKSKHSNNYGFNCTVFSHPRFAALRMLASDKTVGHSLSLNEVTSKKIGNFGFVWLSDINRPYEYGSKTYKNSEEAYKAVLKEDSYRLNSDEASEVLKSGKEYYFDMMIFFRDNVLINLSAPQKHIPLREEYNVYDFAKEVDVFIQKQATVDEFKPATLEFIFENYNVETYEWEPAKDFLQAAFIDVENDIQEYKELYEKALKKFGLVDEKGRDKDDIDKELRNKLYKIENYLEHPMRMKVGITDQLGNKGGECYTVGIFKGQPGAKIPDPLTLEHLEKIYDIEIEKGIKEEEISWFEDEWSYVDRDEDDNQNLEYFKLTPGRYIIVIDVTTKTNVKSRHFYELKTTTKKE